MIFNLFKLLSIIYDDANGKMKPDMFSTIPSTFKCVFLQKFNSLRTSPMDASCGVVITTQPSLPSCKHPFKYCTMEICSSLVPGGVSTIK